MSSYHFLSENIAYVGHICNFDQSSICVFVFACQTNRNFVFEVLVPLPFQKYFEYFWILWRKKLYSRICVFAFMYLHIRHSGTLFLRSSYHYLFKNITYVKQTVFVYLCICIYVFAHQILGNIIFEVLVPSPLQKYSTCCAYVQLWPKLAVFVYLCICVFVYLCICIWVTREWWQLMS